MDTRKIGAFIALNRKKQNLTQAQLAEKLGVTNKTVSRWENGNYMPDLSLLLPLSRELDITLNELLTGEAIPAEQSGTKAEESLAETLRYSDRLLRREKRRFWAAIGIFILIAIGVALLLDAVYSRGVPYMEGDVSAWEGQFPMHSAYAMGISYSGRPVFQDPEKAFAQARTDYSDAIRAIQKQYHLLPMSKYNYRSYGRYAGQTGSDDMAVTAQGKGLAAFAEIYGNSFAWKDAPGPGHRDAAARDGEGDGGMTEYEMFVAGWWIPLMTGLLAAMYLGFALYHLIRERKMRSLPGRTTGVITGMVRSLPFRNQVYGSVPDATMLGWGVSQGDQAWGSLMRVRIPPWFPCVTFDVDGTEYTRLTGEGARKNTWQTGQRVTVLFDPANPRVSTIEGDDSLRIKAELNAAVAVVSAVACAVSWILFCIG